MLKDLRYDSPPLVPFHWEIEFPEVFERRQPGFDAITGNPPFGYTNTVISTNPTGYLSWLKALHDGSHGNADLVAHFYRRAFALLRPNGTFGLIATNTIGQGDTRATGLRWILGHGGEIYAARKRIKWPGHAAVVVSVVHLIRGEYRGRRLLNERPVDTITAYLFHAGTSDDPVPLSANIGKSYIGCYVLGMGITFDDTDTRGVANSLAEMRRLVQEEPRNREVIFPYLGGQEVNNTPTHVHHRYVINFNERSEVECRQGWPSLMEIIEQRVRPEREAQHDAGAKEKWWQFIRPRPELHAAIKALKRVLVVPRTTSHLGFVFLQPPIVFSENIVVFALDQVSGFAVLQSRLHDVWVRFTSSTFKDDLGYRPSDCFDTFPFPRAWEFDAVLETSSLRADASRRRAAPKEGYAPTLGEPQRRSGGGTALSAPGGYGRRLRNRSFVARRARIPLLRGRPNVTARRRGANRGRASRCSRPPATSVPHSRTSRIRQRRQRCARDGRVAGGAWLGA